MTDTIHGDNFTLYLIPARVRRIPGDSHACHIAQDGAALCGTALGEPYRESQYRYAYNVCKACERAQASPQMALIAEGIG